MGKTADERMNYVQKLSEAMQKSPDDFSDKTVLVATCGIFRDVIEQMRDEIDHVRRLAELAGVYKDGAPLYWPEGDRSDA
jgi:acyl-CoA reductase-like NAD-dependent aldehyde dehydrogenase